MQEGRTLWLVLPYFPCWSQKSLFARPSNEVAERCQQHYSFQIVIANIVEKYEQEFNEPAQTHLMREYTGKVGESMCFLSSLSFVVQLEILV